jgi:hypothetical protein
MIGTKPSTLVIIDYSGTLSLKAPLFGREELLIDELKKTGFTEFGIRNGSDFWDLIINPTWETASTSSIGYSQVIFEQVCKIRQIQPGSKSEGAIQKAARRLIGDYYAYAAIAPEWENLFKGLDKCPGVMVTVATDHYTETSVHILRQLESLGSTGCPALQTGSNSAVKVANSADLGFPKGQKGFWERLKAVQDLKSITNVVVLEDFGFNEEPTDIYAQEKTPLQRSKDLTVTLTDVFNAPVSTFQFFLTGYKNPKLDETSLWIEYKQLINDATAFILRSVNCSNNND